MVTPLMGTDVLVQSQVTAGRDPSREVRDDERKVARCRDHRVSAVSIALSCDAGMSVNIGYDLEVRFAAKPPKRPESDAVEDDNTAVQTARVEVVKVHEPVHPSSLYATTHRAITEEKRAALATPTASASQLGEPGMPERSWASEAVFRCEERHRKRPYSRRN